MAVDEEKLKAKVLKALAERPRDAGSFPMPQRRVLRVLEKEGRIYCDVPADYVWRIVAGKEE